MNIVTNRKRKNFLDMSYGLGSYHTHKADLNAQYVLKNGVTLRPTFRLRMYFRTTLDDDAWTLCESADNSYIRIEVKDGKAVIHNSGKYEVDVVSCDLKEEYLFFGEDEIGLLYTVAVDSLEVVLHRDDGIAGFAPLGLTPGSLFKVSMVADIIVSDEHEGGGAIPLVALAVVVHGLIATAVAEGQYGHLANLLRNLEHLVGLEVLDKQTVGANQVFVATHIVVDTGIIALLA